ncbi:MAG TPA: 5'-3' exonuclease H3TH domain-containing protein [Acidobacteriota bacterium]
MAIRLLLVDALNLVRRVYAAQPGDDGPVKAEGAKVSCVQSLQRALNECRPSHAIIVFEGREPGWRHLLFRDYKRGHAPMPEALREALPAYRDAFAAAGVTSFELPRVEADDVVGTLAVKIAGAGGQAVILSTDKIFLQLLSDRIVVRDHFKQHDLGRAYVVERFGVGPEQLVDLLALAGDSTNNIPGVPGIGVKTAAKLIAEHGTLEAILAAADPAAANPAAADLAAAGPAAANPAAPDLAEADPASASETTPAPSFTPKLRERLVDHAEDARLARSLVSLQIDLDLGINLKDLRYRG